LRYFQVARNFAGLREDGRASLVCAALLHIRAQPNLSAEEKVLERARSFNDAGFQHNVSAASKLLWLSDRSPFIIFDSRAFSALKIKFEHRADRRDYLAYCESWRKAYKVHQHEIRDAVKQLPTIMSFLPASTPPAGKLLSIVTTPWFAERVFDIYLWELGGDGKT
jgi:hypothetical protein